jgi:hypothetical protein
LEARLAAIQTPTPTLDSSAVREQLRSYLVDWQGLLRANVQQGQQVLRRLVKGRITFSPHAGGYYTFSGAPSPPAAYGVGRFFCRKRASVTSAGHISPAGAARFVGVACPSPTARHQHRGGRTEGRDSRAPGATIVVG